VPRESTTVCREERSPLAAAPGKIVGPFSTGLKGPACLAQPSCWHPYRGYGVRVARHGTVSGGHRVKLPGAASAVLAPPWWSGTGHTPCHARAPQVSPDLPKTQAGERTADTVTWHPWQLRAVPVTETGGVEPGPSTRRQAGRGARSFSARILLYLLMLPHRQAPRSQTVRVSPADRTEARSGAERGGKQSTGRESAQCRRVMSC